MATNLRYCPHGVDIAEFNWCVDCRRTADRASIEAARQEGYREAIAAALECTLPNTTARRRIRALTPPSGGGEGEPKCPHGHGRNCDGCLTEFENGGYLRALADMQKEIEYHCLPGHQLFKSLARLRQGEGK